MPKLSRGPPLRNGRTQRLRPSEEGQLASHSQVEPFPLYLDLHDLLSPGRKPPSYTLRFLQPEGGPFESCPCLMELPQVSLGFTLGCSPGPGVCRHCQARPLGLSVSRVLRKPMASCLSPQILSTMYFTRSDDLVPFFFF